MQEVSAAGAAINAEELEEGEIVEERSEEIRTLVDYSDLTHEVADNEGGSGQEGNESWHRLGEANGLLFEEETNLFYRKGSRSPRELLTENVQVVGNEEDGSTGDHSRQQEEDETLIPTRRTSSLNNSRKWCFRYVPGSGFLSVLLHTTKKIEPPSNDKSDRDEEERHRDRDQGGTEEQRSPGCDYTFDETSGSYYCRQTNLYFDPQSYLYSDITTYPATMYHRFMGDYYVQVLLEVTEEAMPDSLILLCLDTEWQTLGCYSVGAPLPEEVKGALVDGVPLEEATSSETEGMRAFTIGRAKGSAIGFGTDLLASKIHARILWQNVYWQNFYWLQDLGSNNGTFLNDMRLSPPRTQSGEKEFPLALEDAIVIGSTVLFVTSLSHLESRLTWPNDTTAVSRDTSTSSAKAFYDSDGNQVMQSGFKPNLSHPIFRPLKEWKEQEEQETKKRKDSNRKRKMCGLTPQEVRERAERASNYQDRSALRMRLVGSTHPSDRSRRPIVEQIEKEGDTQRLEQTAPEPQAQETRGRAMMEAMGWQEGKGLGRDGGGIVAPVEAYMENLTAPTKGLGYHPTTRTNAGSLPVRGRRG